MKGDDVAAGMRRKERLSFLRPDFPMDTSTRRVAVAPRYVRPLKKVWQMV